MLQILPGIPLGPKPTTSPLKSFKSCGHFSKNRQNVQSSDFQSQISMSKMVPIFLKKIFIEEYHLRSTIFVRSTPALNQVIEKSQFLTFKVKFLCQKLSESFSFFSLKNINLGAHFLLMTFFHNINF